MLAGAGASLLSGLSLSRWRLVALCCPLINKVFLVGWWREGPLPHVIGVEFGWRLLNCVEGPNFVVWSGNGIPKTQLGLLFLYTIFFVPVMSFSLGPGSFPERTLYLVLNFLPCLWYFSKIF